MTSNPGIRTEQRRLSLPEGCALIAGALTCIVLCGWTCHLNRLVTLLPGLPATAVPTALGLLLSSVALFLQMRRSATPGRRAHPAGAVVAMAALLFGFATLAYFAVVKAPTRVVPLPGAAVEPVNRTSPNTAINLILLSGSICLLDTHWGKRRGQRAAVENGFEQVDDFWIWPYQILILTVVLDAFFALVGQIYGLTLLYGLSRTFGMAPSTAIILIVLGLGVLAARPERGFVRIVLSKNVAGQAARRLIPIAIAAPIVLGGITLLGFRSEASLSTYALVVVTIVLLVSLFWGSILSLHRQVERALSFERQLADQAIAIERQAVEIERAELIVKQRRFVREIMASVTEGKLCLCDSSGDLPEYTVAVSDLLDLTPVTLRQLRRRVQATAEELGFPDDRKSDLITAVGEAGMNAVKHGGGGTARVHADRKRRIVQVSIQDKGTGIRDQDLHRATLEKGWSGAGSFGHGFYLMLRTADRTYLLTGDQGTTIVLEHAATPPAPEWEPKLTAE